MSPTTNQHQEPVQWKDLRTSLTAGKPGATKPPAFSQAFDNGAGSVGVFAWSFGDEAAAGNEENIFLVVQLPHDYAEGTNIEAHVHWTPAVGGAAGEFVKWGLEYNWTNRGGSIGNTTIVTSDASSAATATKQGDASMVANKHYVTELGDIDGTSKTISSLLLCRLFRNSSHANDDLAQDAFGLSLDFHYQADTRGSEIEDNKTG